MGIVFISYRRDDTAGEARALYNDLAKLLGEERVFMDVDDIALGLDFREVLRQRLNDCQVMLALIGRGWLDARDETGARRLDQPGDFVRLEIATALERGIPVTPVLLKEARAPHDDDLPAELKGLAFRNGFPIRHETWASNVQELVRRLGLAPPAPVPARPASRLPLLAGGGVLALLALAAGFYATRPGPAPAPAPVVDGTVIDSLVADLVLGEVAAQKAAADRLRQDHLRSPQAVRALVAQLEPNRFFAIKSFRQRSEVVGLLIAAEPTAWTPDARAQAQLQVRRLKESVAAGRAKVTPEMDDLLDRLAARLGG